MAALVFIATSFLRVPVSAQAYIHFGDGFILIGVYLLGWTAVPAAAVGSMLADLVGYPIYCPYTFVIKAAVAAIAVLAVSGRKPYWLTVVMFAAAELVMVVGYFIAEWLMIGYGLEIAAGYVISNIIQGAGGVAIGSLLIPALRGVKKQIEWQ